MGRDRKAQFGVTNLNNTTNNNTTTTSNANNNNKEEGNTSGPSKFARSWTHKLISPDVYDPPAANNDNKNKLKTTATWKPVEVTKRDFTTTQSESFLDPKSIQTFNHPSQKTTLQIAEENIKKQTELKALDNLCNLVQTSYGTVASMVRSFNKKPTDTFSLYEFNEYLKRNKLENYLPPTDTELVFQHINHSSQGIDNVPIKDFLKTVEEREFQRNEKNKDILKIRDFLASRLKERKLEKQRLKKQTNGNNGGGGDDNDELEKKKMLKGIENEAEKIKSALGMKTFDLEDVNYEDFSSIIEDSVYQKLPTTELQRSYARFLHHSNLKLSFIPFYDMRNDDLNRMKSRAVNIDKELESDEIGGRFKELSKIRWVPSLATMKQSEIETLDVNVNETLNKSKNNTMQLSKSLNDLHVSARPSPLASLPNANNKSNNDLMLPQGSNSPLKPLKTQPKSSNKPNLATDHRGMDYDDLSTSNPSMSSPYVNDNQSQATNNTTNSTSKLRQTALEPKAATNKLNQHEFYASTETTSIGRVKDPTKVMRIEKIDPKAFSPTGKRKAAQSPTDWSRVSVGRDPHEIGYGKVDEEEIYRSTNSFNYPPLIYEPSQPVRREGITENELAHRKKEYRRLQRLERTKANLAVTEARLEYEELEKKIRSMNRESSKINEGIRYKTSIFLNDLQQFRSQPLQRMAKRQNITLSDRMWNGSIDKQTVVLVDDERDFNTTYTSSILHKNTNKRHQNSSSQDFSNSQDSLFASTNFNNTNNTNNNDQNNTTNSIQ